MCLILFIHGSVMQPITKIAIYIPVVIVCAAAYDYCYRNVHLHFKRCVALGFALAFVTGTWGSSLFTPWFAISEVLFGLASGVILAISFAVIGKHRQKHSSVHNNPQE